ncbi:MAG: hypothetical protein ACREIF_02970 [Chthoniobacterales bacterium]
MKRAAFCAALCLALLRVAIAQDLFDRLDQTLTIGLLNDQFRARLSGLWDLEYYHFPQPPPGLIRADGHDLIVPRLTVFLDAELGSHIYFFAQSRLDTGFDPANQGPELRLVEYALRLKPWNDGRFTLQIGKFATIVGDWVERHHSWENPFVTAPLPYETVTRVSDSYVPLTGETFRYVRGSDKYEFLPIIWGPVYATGVAVAGRIGIFEYAAELKNVPVASRPEYWSEYDFNRPAVDLRVGLQPNEAWRFGFSAAEGTYLRADAQPEVPANKLDDYREILLGQDVSYARGHLQIWAEIFEARFEDPRLGNSDVLAYYLSAKYKITPQLFAALRWSQELFDSGRDAAGRVVARPPDVARVDLAFGYRFTAHTQLKLQYSLAHGDFISSRLGSTIATQFTIRF